MCICRSDIANLALSPHPFQFFMLKNLESMGTKLCKLPSRHGGYPVVDLSYHRPTANGSVEPILSIWPLVSAVVGISRLSRRIHTHPGG